MKQFRSPSHVSVDDSSIVDMDYFVRTLSGIHAKGLRPDLIGSIITNYASMWLPDLFAQSSEKLEHDSPESSASTARWTRKRMCVEALAVMLPPERGSVKCDFLLRLLRVGSMVGAQPACLVELERRVTWQLEQASLKELMIPSFSHTCGTLLDVGLVLSFDQITRAEFREIFKLWIDYSATRWYKISRGTTNLYWQQFQEYFYWDTNKDFDIWWCYNEMAPFYYNEYMKFLKENEFKPCDMRTDVWDSLKLEWENVDTDEEYIAPTAVEADAPTPELSRTDDEDQDTD